MKTVRIIAVLLLVLCIMPLGVFAEDTLVPDEVVASTTEDAFILEKVYTLPKGTEDTLISREAFTESDIEYVFVEMKVKDNTAEDVKEHMEIVSFHTSTNDAETVMALFTPTVEITTEDGYIGTLVFDHSTLELSPAGYSSRKFTVTEERSYPNLASADTSLVPKTIDKDGVTLTLAGIEWSSSANENVDGADVTVRYTANAVYTGTATKSYVNGYTASAFYKGNVTKVVNDTVTYTAVFKGVKEADAPVITIQPDVTTAVTPADDTSKTPVIIGAAVVGIISVIGLAFCGYAVYRLIRKKRKGY